MKVGFAIVILALAAGPAQVRDGQRPPARTAISAAQAVQIARGYGMVRVDQVERDDGGWEVEGRDHRGRKLEVTINRQGRVTDVDRAEAGDDDDGDDDEG